MKLVSFEKNARVSLGVFERGMIYDLHSIDSNISESMLGFLQGGETQLALANKAINNGSPSIAVESINLL